MRIALCDHRDRISSPTGSDFNGSIDLVNTFVFTVAKRLSKMRSDDEAERRFRRDAWNNLSEASHMLCSSGGSYSRHVSGPLSLRLPESTTPLDMQPNSCISLAMTRKNAAKLDAVFHALADSTRRTILEELANRDEQSLYEICVRLVEGHGLSMKRQSISKHLAVLEDAGLVHTNWQGRTKLHSTNVSSAVPLVARWLKHHK